MQDAKATGDSDGQPVQHPPDAQVQLIAQIAAQVAASHCKDKEAACEQVRTACKKQHALERQQLLDDFESEKASIMKRHEAQLAQAADMKRRQQADSSQFHYIVRGIQEATMSGSVPRQIFGAEPDSVLNHMYNGEWEYAQDDQGRAVINSDPEHWPLILNWLSYGAVPRHPSSAFLAECRYGNLDNLLCAVQQAAASTGVQSVKLDSPGKHNISVVRISKDGRAGFRLAGVIRSFSLRMHDEDEHGLLIGTSVVFEAFGQKWTLNIDEEGIYLDLVSLPSHKNCHLEIGFGTGSTCYQVVDKDCSFWVEDEEYREFHMSTTGIHWKEAPSAGQLGLQEGESPLDALQKEPFVDLLGDLQVFVTVLFARKSAQCMQA